ncbi:MAG: hypothetical protein K8S23_04900 [Candidatus Cloacimonetes bacterium]|nr:hypothetical protein [Candidatus Cloacimonadota bacterium]
MKVIYFILLLLIPLLLVSEPFKIMNIEKIENIQKNDRDPMLYFYPISFNKTIPMDDFLESPLTIDNDGDEELIYSASVEYRASSRNDLLNEDFENGVEWPQDWLETTNSAIGWFITTDGSSTYWEIPPGNGLYACSNDDIANDDGSLDYLYTPFFDLSLFDSATLTFNSFFTGEYFQSAKVEIYTSYTWQELVVLSPNVDWTEITIDLTSFCGPGNLNVGFRFHSNDNGHWASGWAIDDVTLTAAGYSGWLRLNDSSLVTSSILQGGPSDLITVGFYSEALYIGTYISDIVITSNDPSSSLVTIPVSLTVVQPAPNVPENVEISTTGTNVDISWDSVSGATSYKVFSSDEPNGDFAEDTTGSFVENSWSTTIQNMRRFYYVTALN